MKRLAILLLLLLPGAPVSAAPLVFTPEVIDGQTGVASAALNGLGLGTIASVSISDNNVGIAGSPGIFSGFDLDFVYIDLDGVYGGADQVLGTVFIFNTGTTRATADPNFLPTLAHPGPTFGSLALNSIDPALSTLNVRDGSFPAVFNADNSSGWLTLGDGGTLLIGFGAGVVLTGTERLFIGEVGGNGEIVDASATASDQPIPVPGTLALLALGAFGLGITRRGLHQRR